MSGVTEIEICYFLKKVTQIGICHFLKKVAQKLFMELRGKILRKSCCVATQNNFEGILTGALKIEDLLLC